MTTTTQTIEPKKGEVGLPLPPEHVWRNLDSSTSANSHGDGIAATTSSILGRIAHIELLRWSYRHAGCTW
jgi:hypothetical protein